MKLLLVVNPDLEHLGCYLIRAAKDLGFDVIVADLRDANEPKTLIERIRYRLRDKRPAKLPEFSRLVYDQCRNFQPDILLATGCAPVLADDLAAIGKLGIRTINFSTDDPWNTAHKSDWFLASLPKYSLVCSPRRATFSDFADLGVKKVEYLPFAYDPQMHHLAVADSGDVRKKCDVLFYGGADRYRANLFSEFVDSGIDLHLYGSYWHRYRNLRGFYRGMLEPNDIRRAVADATVTICISRKSNRDSHAMRSYEAAAMGGCMLVERSEDHLKLFGQSGDTVCFFTGAADILYNTRNLLKNAGAQKTMRKNVYQCITGGENAYVDRLKAIVKIAQNLEKGGHE